ncbi:hypothetical protein SynRCC2555_01678 [Synechococcus sp. WH 8101]|nr:hypothetical protein SynRCC2555_01678 [Synechococcus sp. WH 8101]
MASPSDSCTQSVATTTIFSGCDMKRAMATPAGFGELE